MKRLALALLLFATPAFAQSNEQKTAALVERLKADPAALSILLRQMHAFGFDHDVLERTVDAHVVNLRRKLEEDPGRPCYVETVYGRGYRMIEPQR